MSQTADPLDVYQDALLRGDVRTITGLVAELLDGGHDPVTLLTDIIASAQREIGWRWQTGQITVADERAATALAVQATTVVAEHLEGTPITHGPVLVTCAEREWHALPAMIISCALRSAGWDTTTLGASPTLARFNQIILDTGPHVVGISASILGSLSTCRRFIEAATSAGIPVLVGGAAFGPDDARARALGATAWAPNAQGAIDVIAGLPRVVPPVKPLPAVTAEEYAALQQHRRRIIAELRQRWTLVANYTASDDEALNQVMDVADDALHQVLNAVTAALLTGDPRPLPQTAQWIQDVLANRGGDITMIVELQDVLTNELRDYPHAKTLLAQYFR